MSRLLILLLISIFSVHVVAATSLQEFKQSWLATALKLQREIDLAIPLNEATFIGTHNSYNSKAYRTPLRYYDPNQTLSIYEQLEAGARSIEFDAHWTINNHFKKKILLCHGKFNHLICSPYDLPFTKGLEELRDWLKANPREIVLLYIERFLNGHEPRLAAELDEYVGQYIYKPTDVTGANNHACVALSGKITKADVLRAGKQLIVITKGCNAGNKEQAKFSQHWNDFVFAGSGDIPSHSYTFIDATINHFTPYPDCGKAKIFYPDIFHTSLWRVYEDRTLHGRVINDEKHLKPANMYELARCGINWPTMDKLEIADPRLNAAIWSWAFNFPRTGSGQCAAFLNDFGIVNIPCNQTSISYLCQEENTHDFKIISQPGTWAQGESICQQAAGKNWHFAVPINGQQMHALKQLIANNFMQEVWLNYATNKQGQWKANAQKKIE